MNKKITDLTETELKAIAYDESIKLQMTQNNLRIINEELSRRAKESGANPKEQSAI